MPPERTSRRRLLAALGATATGLAGCSAPESASLGARTRTDSIDRNDAAGAVTPGDNRFSRVYRETVGSVVLVRTYSATGGGQGSGFVFDGGHVATNEHVVAGAEEVEVRFNEGEWRTATVAGVDAYSDLAALSVEERPEYADPLALIEADAFVGQEVLAIGNPFGLSSTISSGIVSGTNRSLPGPNDYSIPGAIQTTAPVNPGNSGGPLVTMGGAVAGVITSGGGENIGFAISARLSRRVLPALVEDGEYRHPHLGVRLVEVTPTVAEPNDLPEATGVLVASVVTGGPADGALEGSDSTATRRGQQIPVGGDVVVALDGREIPSLEALSTYLALEKRPGEEIEVTVLRGGERRTVELVLGTRPLP